MPIEPAHKYHEYPAVRLLRKRMYAAGDADIVDAVDYAAKVVHTDHNSSLDSVSNVENPAAHS